MAQDQNKKTLRSFQCRDYLYEIFEQMSQELECSVDYLINEAMRQYARSRNYGTKGSSGSSQRLSQPPPSEPNVAPTSRPPSRPAIPSISSAAAAPSRPVIPSAPPPLRPSGGYGPPPAPPRPQTPGPSGP